MIPKPGQLELMFRIKLPDEDECTLEGLCNNAPEKDYENTRSWRMLILDSKPPGYEVKWPSKGEVWPADSEGFTWVPLYLTNAKDATSHWMSEYYTVKNRLDKLKHLLSQI